MALRWEAHHTGGNESYALMYQYSGLAQRVAYTSAFLTPALICCWFHAMKSYGEGSPAYWLRNILPAKHDAIVEEALDMLSVLALEGQT